MKYAFIYSVQAVSKNGGVKLQAEMWRDGLERLGHQVDMVSSWSPADWKSYDVLLFFGFGPGSRSLVSLLSKENPHLVIAPIIDPTMPAFMYKFICKWWGSYKYLRLSSRFHDLWLLRKYPILWLIRSEEERHYTHYCLERPFDMIAKVPLHFRIPQIKEMPAKEDFCFHASRLEAGNKNVPRLIEAARKYGFKLKLAGFLNGDAGKKWLNDQIAGADNIEYLGQVSEAELQDLYKRAKVFALPSLHEGVGMVALEAAAYGCEVVLTNVGAPKEYYDGRAILVNPKSVDEIGQGIMKALKDGYSQPELKTYIETHFSERACMTLLNDAVAKAINRTRQADVQHTIKTELS